MSRAILVVVLLAILAGVAWLLMAGRGGPCGRPAPTGASLFRDRGCASCHGASGEGGDRGPSLARPGGLVARERLEDYLKSPTRVLPQSKMPSVPLTDDEARMLAEHVDSLRR